MLIPDPRLTPLPNLISHNGIILHQWEFLRARLDEGEGLPWIAMDPNNNKGKLIWVQLLKTPPFKLRVRLEIDEENYKLGMHRLIIGSQRSPA